MDSGGLYLIYYCGLVVWSKMDFFESKRSRSSRYILEASEEEFSFS